ncbi:5186_t:CDS:2 [Acaulospora colombiana]|uniref:5186_t:CDS:1 n=1 Tax=Acaulospora colombiana TaxID=27376 RepID=A0ACA9M3A7_9GLOM|nr:5186_t:CDS:2 [Acaulospora colombiana]
MIEEYTKRSTKTERKTTAVQKPSEDRNLTAHGFFAWENIEIFENDRVSLYNFKLRTNLHPMILGTLSTAEPKSSYAIMIKDSGHDEGLKHDLPCIPLAWAQRANLYKQQVFCLGLCLEWGFYKSSDVVKS